MKLKLLNYVLLPMGFIFSNGIKAQNDTGPGDTAVIEEVSVTATGMKQSTRKMGYTTSQVQGKKLATTGEGGVIQALTGKASNVQITKNSGDPGAGAYIQIRGQNLQYNPELQGQIAEARKKGEMLQKDGAVTQIFGNHLFISGKAPKALLQESFLYSCIVRVIRNLESFYTCDHLIAVRTERLG